MNGDCVKNKEMNGDCGKDKETKKPATILVYVMDGRVFSYDVAPKPDKVREHIHAIITEGFRHNDGKGTFESFPTHRIKKVKCVNLVIPTSYPSTACGT